MSVNLVLLANQKNQIFLLAHNKHKEKAFWCVRLGEYICVMWKILVLIFPASSLSFLEPQRLFLTPSYFHKTPSTFSD